MHFVAFLCIPLHFSAFLCNSLQFFALTRFFAKKCREMQRTAKSTEGRTGKARCFTPALPTQSPWVAAYSPAAQRSLTDSMSAILRQWSPLDIFPPTACARRDAKGGMRSFAHTPLGVIIVSPPDATSRPCRCPVLRRRRTHWACYPAACSIALSAQHKLQRL